MKNRVFLDTNVVLDFLDKQRKNHEKAKELFVHIATKNLQVVISEDMLSTIYYIEKNRERVLEFYKNIVIKNWVIAPFGTDVIKNSVDMSLQNGSDLEDLLQCYCAMKEGCHFLITGDSEFCGCGIKAYGIGEYLAHHS